MYLSGMEGFKKFGRWAFYIFVIIFPFINYNGYLYYATSTRSLNLIIFIELLVLLFCFLLFKSQEKIEFFKSPITIILIIYFFVALASSLIGVDFTSSFWSKATRMTGLFYILHLGVFYFLFTFLFNDEIKIRKFLSFFIGSALLFALFSLLSNDGLGLIFVDKSLPGFTFGNSTFAAMYLFAAFSVSIYYVFSKQKKDRPWWGYFIPIIILLNPYFINKNLLFGDINILKAPFSVIGEAKTSSIAILFFFSFLMIFYLIKNISEAKIRKKIFYLFISVVLIFGAYSSYSLIKTDSFFQKIYLESGTKARPIVWNLSKQAIKIRPFLGWGVDNFDYAFEKYYDNTILEKKNGAEPWFDRAHNFLIDQSVEVGLIGLLVYLMIYLTIIYCLSFVFLNSKNKNDMLLSSVLMAYFICHLIELQTAFDTSISYVSLFILISISSVLYNKISVELKQKTNLIIENKNKNFLSILLIFSFFSFFIFVTIPIIRAENMNSYIRKIGSSEKRLPNYHILFGSPMDKPMFLWRTSMDIQRGISSKPEILENKDTVAGFVKEFEVISEEYLQYLNKKKNKNQRVILGLANVYIYQSLFGVDKLDDAQKLLDEALLINPNIPQTYWMKSVAYLYQGKFLEAKEWSLKGLELNPEIEQSKKIVSYINRSVETFPEIDLYSFWQI